MQPPGLMYGRNQTIPYGMGKPVTPYGQSAFGHGDNGLGNGPGGITAPGSMKVPLASRYAEFMQRFKR